MQIIKKFTDITLFATERLIARRVTAEDYAKFLLMYKDPQVMASLGGERDEKQIQTSLSCNLQGWTDNGFGWWMFYLKDTEEWIGYGGLRLTNIDDCGEVELAYALMPKFWRQGFATEIAKACIEVAFEILQLVNIVTFTLPSNIASQKVMEKAGFQYEKDIIHAGLTHRFYRLKDKRFEKN